MGLKGANLVRKKLWGLGLICNIWEIVRVQLWLKYGFSLGCECFCSSREFVWVMMYCTSLSIVKEEKKKGN